MSDFNIKVTAQTQDAETKLSAVDQAATKATRDRQLRIDVPSIGSISKTFENLQKSVKDAANDIKLFYSVAKNLPGIGEEVKRWEDLGKGSVKTTKALSQNIKTADILKNSFEAAGSSIERVVNNLAKLGFALYGIKEVVGVLQGAYKGFFDQTIGREIQLRETILKTQTTLASTSKVFKDGREITDPYQKIVTLTGAVAKNIDSIRERSIELAGVTSNDVIEVFGIVASQIGQVGGGLKEAEDLAINFAAALGTFGLPLYQANQEIGSILRGQITEDSYLARSLGIGSADIAKAKGEAGGVIKFIQDKLAASVAGQKIAAQGFSGVMSNIRDLAELAGQRFGSGLLDPLLSTITRVFETLNKIRDTIFDMAEGAGRFVGRFNALGLTVAEKVSDRLGGQGRAPDGQKAAEQAQATFQRGIAAVELALQRATEGIANIIVRLQPAFAAVTDAFARLIKVFLQIRVSIFESLVSAVSNLVTAASPLINVVAQTFNIYSRFLALPIIQRFSELKAQYDLLKRAGLDFITNAILIGTTLFRVVIPAIGGVKAAIGVIIVSVGALITAIGSLTLTVSGIVLSLSSLPSLAGAAAAGLTALARQLGAVSSGAAQAGARVTALGNGFNALGATAKAAGASLLKSIGWVFVFQAGITLLVDEIGQYQRAQENLARSRRAEMALKELSTTYKDVGDSADSATKAAKEFRQQIVDAEYGSGLARLEEIKNKLQELRKEAEFGYQSWGEFFNVFNPVRIVKEAFDFSNEPAQRRAIRELEEEAARIRKLRAQVDAQRDKEQLKENIQIAAQDRTNLEKEINGLRRQQESDLFQLRQQLASKEVEIFRAAGELRIFQMEQANKKMLEGQEGASAAALEALNNYLSTRERGELAIEAEKKQLIIEGANLQRQIEDYRFANEQKIQELKRAGAKYEQEVADYRLQAARQAAQAQAETPATPGGVNAATPVTNGFRVGSSGKSSGPHLDIRGPNREAVIREALAIIKYWQTQNLPYIQLSNSKIDVKNMRDDAALIAALRKEQIAHDTTRRRRIGQSQGAIDIAVPMGTLVPARTSAPQWDPNGGGWTAKSLDTGNSLLHGARNSRASTGGAAPAAASSAAAPPPPLLPPRAPTLDAVGAPAVEKYADAVRRLSSALERSRALQEALTNAQTKAAFDEIAKAAFPTVAIEDYDNQIKQARINLAGYLTAIEKSAGFDPERMQAELDMQAQLEISARELTEIRERAQKALNPTEYAELQKQLLEREAKYNEQLKQQVRLRNQLVPLTRAVERVQTAGQNIETLTQELNSNKQALEALTKLGEQAYNPDQMELYLQSLREAARIEKEIPEFKAQLLALLERENKLRGENLQLTKATEAVQTMQRERNALPFELQRETVRVTAEMARSFGNEDDFLRRRLIDAEVRIAERRIQLEQDQTKSIEQVTTELGRFADAQRNAAGQLAAMDQAMSDFSTKMALIKDISRTYVDGYKNIIKTAMQGGDIGEAMNNLLQSVADKFLNAALDVAFKPIEAMWQEQLKGLFGVQDPMAAFVEAQTRAAEQARTQEQALIQQQQDAAAKQLQAANTQLQAAQARTTTPTPVRLGVDPWNPDSENTTPAASPITELNKNAEEASDALAETASSAKQTSPLFGNLSTAVTGVVGALAGVAMGFAGFQQLKKGGTYNTLMGLAGIFGSIGSITGMFGKGGALSGLFKAQGGPVTANRPYIVGEVGPELFVPSRSGTIVPNNQLGIPESDNPYALTTAALGGSTSSVLRPYNNEPIKIDTRVINGVEYVTTDQLREATAMAEQRGAERGTAMTLSRIRNSVKTRKQSGF